jgi:hypothetical protein
MGRPSRGLDRSVRRMIIENDGLVVGIGIACERIKTFQCVFTPIGIEDYRDHEWFCH